MAKSTYFRLMLIMGLFIGQSIPARADGATVRVTTGSVSNAGWEHNLVHGNPNLKHFGWYPVIDNVQGTMKVYPAKGPNIVMPASRVNSAQNAGYKPIHVPTIVHRAPDNDQPFNFSSNVDGTLNARKVSPALKQNNNELAVRANLSKPAEVAVYSDGYGQLENQSVSGKLTNENVHAHIMRSAQTQNPQF